MKFCRSCGLDKPFIDFTKHSDSPDGLYRYCRLCKRERENGTYDVTRSQSILLRKQERTAFNRLQLMKLLATSCCQDCGESDPVVLEFDHTSDDKSSNVSLLVQQGYGWKRVLAEIAKCDIVCANCHRRRTYSRCGSYRLGETDAA